jgi:Ca2+ transporting ATPase
MTLTTFWNQKHFDLDTYSPEVDIGKYVPSEIQELFIVSACNNSSAALRPQEKGSKTEVAVLEFMDRCKHKYEFYRNKYKTI